MPDRRPNTRPTLDILRWRRLCTRLGLTDADRHFAHLRKAYRQFHRRYHNESHIVSCLRHLDDSGHPDAAEPLLEFAVWCHDVVYRTYSSRNEIRSAEWAQTLLISAGASQAEIDATQALIMATCHGAGQGKLDHSRLGEQQKLIADVDLAILAVPSPQFGEFERAIRQEYWWVSGKTFRRNRTRLFTDLLRQPSIYQTIVMQERYESAARKNLEHALLWLRHYQTL